MKTIKVYTWTVCPYCDRAKNLLTQKGLEYTEINLDGKNDELKSLRQKTGYRSIPQIFIGEEFIGGFQELSNLNAQGKLDSMVERD